MLITSGESGLLASAPFWLTSQSLGLEKQDAILREASSLSKMEL